MDTNGTRGAPPESAAAARAAARLRLEAAARAQDAEQDGRPISAALAELLAELQVLRRGGERWLRARKDRAVASLRHALLAAAFALVGAVVLVAALVAATALLFAGLGDLLGEAFGNPGLGDLVAGLGFLVLVFTGLSIGAKVVKGRWRKATIARHRAALAEDDHGA